MVVVRVWVRSASATTGRIRQRSSRSRLRLPTRQTPHKPLARALRVPRELMSLPSVSARSAPVTGYPCAETIVIWRLRTAGVVCGQDALAGEYGLLANGGGYTRGVSTAGPITTHGVQS